MGWTQQDTARAGQWLMGDVGGGFTLDVLTNVTNEDILTKARETASGWTPEFVQWERGIFGVGETLRIFGRATAPVPTITIAGNMADAINSFWFVAGASVTVTVSDNLVAAPTSKDGWKTALQWAAAAAIVGAIAFTVYQLRRTFNE